MFAAVFEAIVEVDVKLTVGVVDELCDNPILFYVPILLMMVNV